MTEDTPQFLEKHYLAIVLDAESRSKVQSLATFEEIRGDHVTLAYPRDGDRFSQEWIPGGRNIGERVDIKTISMFATPSIEVLLVAIDESTLRPFDGKKFHVTVSKDSETESNSANDVIREGAGKPIELLLSGTIQWIDKDSASQTHD